MCIRDSNSSQARIITLDVRNFEAAIEGRDVCLLYTSGTFVSCKDYDDDIDRFDKELSEIKETIASLDSAIKAGKFVQSCTEVTGGYEPVSYTHLEAISGTFQD